MTDDKRWPAIDDGRLIEPTQQLLAD